MKITYAKNSLREALAAAPPQMAKTALANAEDMLTKISNDCIERVDALIASFPASGGNTPKDVLANIETAYEIGRKMIGIGTIAGMPDMDVVANSLCDVADGLIARGYAIWEPIRVHVSAMELMRRSDLSPEACEQLILGLRSLRDRYVSGPALPDGAAGEGAAAN